MPVLIGTVRKETDKALLVEIKQVKIGKEEPYEFSLTKWVPVSQITSTIRDPAHEGCDEITISEWIAEKIGIYDELD
jgi:hypothetical protein